MRSGGCGRGCGCGRAREELVDDWKALKRSTHRWVTNSGEDKETQDDLELVNVKIEDCNPSLK